MADVTARWAGAADAASGSTYKVEYTLNNVDWVVAAVSQAATAPYAPVTGALLNNTAYGVVSIVLASGTSFGTSGYAYIDDALVQWTGKSTNTLTGVTWHSGAGTYAADTSVVVAHESLAATGITIGLNAVLWRITHTNPAGLVSAPAYLWYFSPPVPASNRHCVIVVSIATDLGVEMRSGLGVQAYLSKDNEFSDHSGAHLDKGMSAAKTQTTNAFGLAFFHCWKNEARSTITEEDSPYIFILDSGSTEKLTALVSDIPNRDWVLLSQVVTSTV
jgi:hypothetical protein